MILLFTEPKLLFFLTTEEHIGTALLAVVSMPTQSKALMVKQRFIGFTPNRSNLPVNLKAVSLVHSESHANEFAVRFVPQCASIRSDLYYCR